MSKQKGLTPKESSSDIQAKVEKRAKAEEMLKKEFNQQEFERKVKGSEMVFHDLYKLEIEGVIKNKGFDDQQPLLEKHEHVHWYHNVNADGRPLKYAAPALGHTHKVEVVDQDENGNPIVEIGPAIVLVNGKEYNYKYDQHTHDVSYIRSEQVQKRVYSPEFLKVKARIDQEERKATVQPRG